MKKFVFLFLLFMGCLVSAQHDANPFAEDETMVENKEAGEIPNASKGPGNPDNGEDDLPLPIDEYVPFLVMTALGIIIYTARKKKNLMIGNTNS